MFFPTVDETTRAGLNSLTLEDLNDPRNYPYYHEIEWYGMDALGHVLLMRFARQALERNWPLEVFVRKSEVAIEHGNLFFPLNRLSAEGLFIPEHFFWNREGEKYQREVALFDSDYANMVQAKAWVDKQNAGDPNSYRWKLSDEQAYALIDRKWSWEDLKKPSLVTQGEYFGLDMWFTTLSVFQVTKKGRLEHTSKEKEVRGEPLTQKVDELSQKLIAYYTAIVEESDNPTEPKS